MLKVTVNGFGRIGRLVTRAAFYSGKVDVWHYESMPLLPPWRSMTHSLTSTTWSTWSSMILCMASSKALSRLRTGSLSSVESPSPPSRSEILPTSNGVMLVLNMLWSPLLSAPPWRGWGSPEGWSHEGHHFCPFCGWPRVCDGCEPQQV